MAPAFIAIEHSLLGYIRQLFGWGQEEGEVEEGVEQPMRAWPASKLWGEG